MWAFPGRFRCGKCGELRGISRRALRSPFRLRIGVCRDCLSRWERTGHRCGQCWSSILGQWDLGLLVDRAVFAHVECGGALLLPFGWNGRFTLPSSIPIGDTIGSGTPSQGRRARETAASAPAAASPSREQ